MDGLVNYLSTGRHSLIAARTKSSADLKVSLERGFILLTFTNTRGGTELGVKLDKERTLLGEADFINGHGVVSLVGRLTLNNDPVELHAELNIATLKGEGNLSAFGA